jgi:hypothetical protein
MTSAKHCMVILATFLDVKVTMIHQANNILPTSAREQTICRRNHSLNTL